MKKLFLLSLFVVFTLLIISFSSVLSLYLINEGDKITVTIAGTDYTVGVGGVSDSDTAVITVNGVPESMDTGQTKKINGLYVYLADVYYYPKEGEISQAKIDFSNVLLINEGDSTIITFDGTDYTVGVSGVSDYDTVVITVNGVSKVIDKDQTKEIGGLDVTPISIHYDPKEGEISSVKLDVSVSTTNKTCTDSDGGINYYTKGEVVVCTFYESDLGGGGGCGALVDYCSGDVLTEGYCEGTSSKSVKYTCPYGCTNGACIETQITTTTTPTNKTCTDSDGGLDYYTKGTASVCTYTGQGVGCINWHDRCRSNTLLEESYCEGNDRKSVEYTCPILCTDGACQNYTCQETDGGYNIYETGITTGVLITDTERRVRDHYDYCLSHHAGPKDGVLMEYWCENGLVRGKLVYCDNGCVGEYHKGACEKSTVTTTIPIEKLKIKITSPREGQTVSGTTTVSASASGPNELGEMTLTIRREEESISKVIKFTSCGGGVACPVGGGACIHTISCNYQWDTSGYDGEVFLAAMITDGYNNKASDSVKVSVINYQSCSEQCKDKGFRYGSCKTRCDEEEVNIGIDGCPQVACAPCIEGQPCPACPVHTCCCASKKPCPYECCVNDPDYLDKPCPPAACPTCVAPPCPPCIQPKCIDHQCVWYPQQEFVLKFRAGWNMFSFPVDIRSYIKATTPTAATEVTVEKAISGKVTEVATEAIEIPPERQCPSPAHIWHYSNGRYIDVVKYPNSVVNGWGYWVKMDYDCIAKITGNKITIDDFPELNSGWNQIGAPSEAVNFYSSIGNCNLLSGPWWYNSDSKKYEKTRVLRPGEGYFVKVKDRCTLGSEIPPLPPEELGGAQAFRVK